MRDRPAVAAPITYTDAPVTVTALPADTSVTVTALPPAAPVAVAVPAGGSVLSVVLEVIGERTGYPVDMIEPDLDLEADLSVDSIKRAGIAGELATRLGLTTTGDTDVEELTKARTAAAITALIERVTGSKTSARRPFRPRRRVRPDRRIRPRRRPRRDRRTYRLSRRHDRTRPRPRSRPQRRLHQESRDGPANSPPASASPRPATPTSKN